MEVTRDSNISPLPFAWRGLVISILIAAIAIALYFILKSQLNARLMGRHLLPWQGNLHFWFAQYGFCIPILLGAFYLALKVKHRWILHATAYILTLYILVLIASLRSWQPFGITLLLQCLPVFYCYPLVLLSRLPARWVVRRTNFFNSSTDERIVFGISSVLWGSALVALLMFLVLWAVKFEKRKATEHAIRQLVVPESTYDYNTNHLRISSSPSVNALVRINDAITMMLLDDAVTIEFINCDITDEVVALFKQQRNQFGEIRFQNCKVVKESAPSGPVAIGNELNEPLPERLPR